MSQLNAATRLLSEQRLTRKELLRRAEEKGYKITHKDSRFIIRKDKNTALVFYEDGAIFFADMDLSAAKKMSLTDAVKALKLQ